MRLSLRQKGIIFLIAPFVLINAIFLIVNLINIRRQVTEDTQFFLTEQVVRYADSVSAALQGVAGIADTTARALSTVDTWQDDDLYALLQGNVTTSPLIFGSAIAFDPAQRPDGQPFAPFVYTSNRPSSFGTNARVATRQMDIAAGAYDYSDGSHQWWSAPYSLQEAVWTEPYFDESAGNIVMSTYSVPFFRTDSNGREFWGVSTADLPLDDLPLVLGLRDVTDVQFMALSSAGLYLFDEDRSKILTQSILEEAEQLGSADLRQLGTQMLAGETGVMQLENGAGELEWVAFAPIAAADWSLAIRLPVSVVTADLVQQMRGSNINVPLSGLLIVTVGYAFSANLTQRIRRLRRAASQLAQGNLTTIPTAGNDELGQLTESLNDMATQIYARETSLRSENVRLADEVEVVRQMQRKLLPDQAELAEVTNLDIAVFMEPANEVGGDYYDVLVQENNVKIAIGDVTGHGLDSGLVMLMTQMGVRTLLEHQERDSSAFLSTLNRALYKNIARMRSNKDLTLLLLDYDHGCEQQDSETQGCLRVSGQHETLLLVRAGGVVEEVDTLELGFPLGLEEDIDAFVDKLEVNLAPGDGVVLYSDGITEAASPQGDLYGLSRLVQVVTQHWQTSMDALKQHIIDDVYTHIAGAEIYDDITLVVLKQM
ncbi:MAG: SpoIIE family protein phosphatase [Deinococcota bacterium]